jgi:glutamate dehydrogenase/leucine dehydrogenase
MIASHDRDDPVQHHGVSTPRCSNCGGITHSMMTFRGRNETLVWYRRAVRSKIAKKMRQR